MRERSGGSRKETTLAGHVKEKGELCPGQAREFHLKVQRGGRAGQSQRHSVFKGAPRETPRTDLAGLRSLCLKGGMNSGNKQRNWEVSKITFYVWCNRVLGRTEALQFDD